MKISSSSVKRISIYIFVLIISINSSWSAFHHLKDSSFIYQQISQPQVLVKRNESGKWGYQIIRDSQLLISQFHIPAIDGKKYFQDSLDAKKVGDLVKLRMLEINTFPSITIDDLKNLKIKL